MKTLCTGQFFKKAVFENVVKQSRTDFCSGIELDCFEKARNDGAFKKLSGTKMKTPKVEAKNVFNEGV